MAMTEEIKERLRKIKAEKPRLKDLSSVHMLVALDWLEENHHKWFEPSSHRAKCSTGPCLVYFVRVDAGVSESLSTRLPHQIFEDEYFDFQEKRVLSRKKYVFNIDPVCKILQFLGYHEFVSSCLKYYSKVHRRLKVEFDF